MSRHRGVGLLLCRLPLRLRLPRLRCWARLSGVIGIAALDDINFITYLVCMMIIILLCQVRSFPSGGYPAHCAAEHAKDHKNILFIGNSYTYGNDLPGMVKNLASAAGGLSVSASD